MNHGQDGSVASIMPAEQWKNITAEQINQGIVVVDHAITYDGGNATGTVPDFNEYVWVSIPDSSKFDRMAWNGPYYASGLQTGEHPLTEISTTNYFWEDKTTTEYTTMVSSVTTNKGFYIGRYEVSKDSTESIAQSKRNQTVWTSIPQTEAITACTNASTPNTHLIYGIEWDSTLNWLIGNATISSSTSKQTKTMELEDIQTNSCSWGNYKNSTGDATINSSVKQITGYSEYWKANNIYDLAGNVSEWTQEKYSTGTSRVNRGGGADDSGSDAPTAHRGSRGETGIDSYERISHKLLLIVRCQSTKVKK